jgi:hypothetical protein
LRLARRAFPASGAGDTDPRWWWTPQTPLGAESRGKRGGVGTIYYWAAEDGLCYMLYLYAKNEQGDLTATQLRTLARVVREEFK